ncbi:hypothetical protein LTT61_14510 [Nocardia asteroides]|nr:hypothetical protein [Nocardia asteroides]UGT64419.1 hypothetical protein LTT61_14510 [Nocardia asteroides]
MVRGREWTGFEAVALQEAMRKSIREFAALLGIETTTINNWRSGLGSVTPRTKIQSILDTTYQQRASVEDRARFDQIVAEGESAWRIRHRGGSDSDVAPGVRAQPPAGTSESFEAPVEVLRRLRALDAGSIDDSVLDVVESALADILDRYELEGPARLAPAAQSLRREVESMIEGCRQPAQLQRLYRLAGQLSGVLAYMAVNRGRFRIADVYCTEALGVAEFIGDRELQAWTKGTQSFCAYYRGDQNAAVAAAEAGLRIAGSGAQSIRLYANGLARALGKLGDAVGVARAVDNALTIATATSASPRLTPALSFAPYGQARLMANAATAHLSAGEYRHTLEYGQLIEEQVNASDSAWSRSLVRLDVGLALVEGPERDAEQAVALGVEALDVSSDRPIRSVWQRAHELGAATAALSVAHAQNYAEKLQSWSERATSVATSDGAIEAGSWRSRPTHIGDLSATVAPASRPQRVPSPARSRGAQPPLR